jgi:hypothetical protein
MKNFHLKSIPLHEPSRCGVFVYTWGGKSSKCSSSFLPKFGINLSGNIESVQCVEFFFTLAGLGKLCREPRDLVRTPSVINTNRSHLSIILIAHSIFLEFRTFVNTTNCELCTRGTGNVFNVYHPLTKDHKSLYLFPSFLKGCEEKTIMAILRLSKFSTMKTPYRIDALSNI